MIQTWHDSGCENRSWVWCYEGEMCLWTGGHWLECCIPVIFQVCRVTNIVNDFSHIYEWLQDAQNTEKENWEDKMKMPSLTTRAAWSNIQRRDTEVAGSSTSLSFAGFLSIWLFSGFVLVLLCCIYVVRVVHHSLIWLRMASIFNKITVHSETGVNKKTLDALCWCKVKWPANLA